MSSNATRWFVTSVEYRVGETQLLVFGHPEHSSGSQFLGYTSDRICPRDIVTAVNRIVKRAPVWRHQTLTTCAFIVDNHTNQMCDAPWPCEKHK